MARVRAENLYRTNPEAYTEQRKVAYNLGG